MRFVANYVTFCKPQIQPNSMAITYCLTDEAPRIAAYSLLPVIEAFLASCGVQLEASDVSLASRILAQFPEALDPSQRVPDTLKHLAALTKAREANIIKPPGMSASPIQLKAAIAELNDHGYVVPLFPDPAVDDGQRSLAARYAELLGSTVNTTLRQGNTHRFIPEAIKRKCRRQPQSNGRWSPESRSHVSTMADGDFRSTEQSVTVSRSTVLRVEHIHDQVTSMLKAGIRVDRGDLVDCAVMRRSALETMFLREFQSAKEHDVLFALQLKRTTMRVADPIVFAHATRIYATLTRERAPELAMSDAAKQISTLHPMARRSIGAELGEAIRNSGRMSDAQGCLRDTKFVIPDSTYADLYQAAIANCIAYGAVDSASVGTLKIVGLSADAAEEYGSQDKTFEIESPGIVRVLDEHDEILFQHEVAAGDIWRMCLTTDSAARSWIADALDSTGPGRPPLVFWLDERRPHERELIRKIEELTSSTPELAVAFRILNVRDATLFTLEQLRAGSDIIAAAGNVLRDYLAELFGRLEAGASSRVQAATCLAGGGRLFESGSGGCAPAIVRDFLDSNHLRWDSSGELLALVESLAHLARTERNMGASELALALQRAIERALAEGRVPSRRVGELDTRGSHFYLAYYWAQELAQRGTFRKRFEPFVERMRRDESRIVDELTRVQGRPVALEGYYRPSADKLAAVMRPSNALNDALRELRAQALPFNLQ